MAVVECLIHRVRLDLELGADLRRRQAEPIPEIENLALPGRQVGKQSAEVVVVLPLAEGVGRSGVSAV